MKNNSDKTSVMVSLSDLDLKNLEVVQDFYLSKRNLELKRASVIKMLLADKATEILETKKG